MDCPSICAGKCYSNSGACYSCPPEMIPILIPATTGAPSDDDVCRARDVPYTSGTETDPLCAFASSSVFCDNCIKGSFRTSEGCMLCDVDNCAYCTGELECRQCEDGFEPATGNTATTTDVCVPKQCDTTSCEVCSTNE